MNNNENFKSIFTLDDAIADGGLRKKANHKKRSPLISIITVVLNGEKHIKECLESLHDQKFKDYEHIIIDGGSSDKTLDIIKNYDDKIEYWCQKKDKGIYDAFNIGMTLCKGEYIGFLNSDDVFTPNAFQHLTNYIANYKEKDFIFGAVKKHWGILYGYRPKKISYSWGFYSSHSTGFFIKLNSAKKVGFYNLKYKFSADYDFFYRMIVKCKLSGIGTKKDEVFGVFRRGGFSSKVSFKDHFFEEISIRLDNNQNKLLVLFILIYKFIKHFKKL